MSETTKPAAPRKSEQTTAPIDPVDLPEVIAVDPAPRGGPDRHPAITQEHPQGLPPNKDINVHQLTVRVRAKVGQNYEWLAKGHGEPKISQDTVRRALRALREL